MTALMALSRRRMLAQGFAALACMPSRLEARSPDAGFVAFLEGLWPAAQAAGVRRTTFDAAFEALTPDAAAPGAGGRQAEFDRPLKDYFVEAVSAARVQRGRAEAARWRDVLRATETRFGVPGEILLAAWGMESDFGRVHGVRDVVRTLATLAFRRTDRPIFADEVVAALVILDRGDVPRAKMRGSWAGAMGDPQFLPSAYLKYAVRYAGDGAPDIWDTPPDVLASIANFLRQSGWKPGRAWGGEVHVPADHDYGSLHRSVGDWAGLGVVPASATPLPRGDATLFLPAGAAGPAFLLCDNYWVVKQYNNSDSYALSLAFMADRIAGGDALATAWPKQQKNWSRAEKTRMQHLLAERGFYDGVFDGRFGPSSRDAIHAFQLRAGVHPADGYAGPGLLQQLETP